jgi:hypothetical protein
MMTHGGEASLPTIATILKTPYAKLGVEATVEVIDRPIFLRRMYRARDWDQLVTLTAAAFDAYSIARAINSRVGSNGILGNDTYVAPRRVYGRVGLSVTGELDAATVARLLAGQA